MRRQFGSFLKNFEGKGTITIPGNMSVKKHCWFFFYCKSNFVVKGVKGVAQFVLPILLFSGICVINVTCVKNRIPWPNYFLHIVEKASNENHP